MPHRTIWGSNLSMGDAVSELAKAIPRPTHSKSGGAIAYYLEDGQDMRRYVETGVIQRWKAEAGRWVFAKGTAKYSITAQDAVELATRRWDEYEEAAIQGMMDATGAITHPEAVRRLAQAATKHAKDGGRGGAAYLKQVREMAGLVRDRGVSAEDAAGNRFSAPSVEELTRLIGQLRAQVGEG